MVAETYKKIHMDINKNNQFLNENIKSEAINHFENLFKSGLINRKEYEHSLLFLREE